MMPHDDHTIHEHSFKIYPRTAISGAAIGTNSLQNPTENIVVAGAVQHWTLVKVGDHKYQLRVGKYPHSGVHEDKLVATANEQDDKEWEIIYREIQDAYTITVAGDPSHAWTTPAALEMTNRIKLRPLVQTQNDPPQFAPRQLFQFMRDD